MLSRFWNLSAALNGYLRFCMPTNRAIDWLRFPRGHKRTVPCALGAAAAYLFAMSLCVTAMERGGPGWLNVVVLICFWGAIKFAWLAVLEAPKTIGSMVGLRRRSRRAMSVSRPPEV